MHDSAIKVPDSVVAGVPPGNASCCSRHGCLYRKSGLFTNALETTPCANCRLPLSAYGRGGGVGRGLGGGLALGDGVGRGVAVGVVLGVTVAVGVAVGVGVGVGVGVPLPAGAWIATVLAEPVLK
jgi:hypothetical protein